MHRVAEYRSEMRISPPDGDHNGEGDQEIHEVNHPVDEESGINNVVV
jgi:hypothetical protein